MKYSISENNGILYRGSIPFFLMNKNKRIIYISSSNRNINDYYFVIKDFYNDKLLKIENYNQDKEEVIGEKHIFSEIIDSGNNFITLMSLNSSIDRFFNSFDKILIESEKDNSYKNIANYLEQNNYTRKYLIEKKGDYSLRGDIIDIYPVNSDYPVRIEFFDNFVESIRYFDIDSQKSVEKLEKIEIYPNLENGEYFSLIEFIKEKNIEVYVENKELCHYRIEEYILLNMDDEEKVRANFHEIIDYATEINTTGFKSEYLDIFKDKERLIEYAKEKNIELLTGEEHVNNSLYKDFSNIKVIKYPHYEGFLLEDKIVLTDRELKGIKVKRVEKRKEGIRLSNINQIKENDYIIHESYGVGLYLGIEEINGTDYILIKYADEDKLFVPVEHINRIEKYIAEPGKVPEIYKLGKKGFSKRREKLKKDIMVFAKELIKLQAKRNKLDGYKFGSDTVWQEEFEEGFPYNETRDQLKAVEDVKSDMESYKAMDRIICGDVGYGKTEVALRAAFKCVMDGKQVAILAPTTVLVHQHYERFVERFKNFPVEIAMISRLETTKEQKIILEKLKNGQIDVIIGTHRLIQKDVEYGDIGLIIIDEEQKFGVKAKESIKEYRNLIDILTLTATPIPRTLNLALLGIKDISIIETPPKNRLPIETDFFEKENKKTRDVILKEIARDGQVFYVYNSVQKMEAKYKELEKILPDYIKITYVHGRMHSQEIKEKIHEFEQGNYDVLLTTTIIENGIDIENANTIIIEDFDKLGLSQIYQLRGRVGRGNRKAYCYLIFNNSKNITKKGRKKIETIDQMHDLGAGFQLSLEDMKIRGAGEILGEKQHGAIEILGYDMYLKLLREEIYREIHGDEYITKDATINIGINGYIPDDYIRSEEKTKLYRRLIMTISQEEVEELKNEVKDRFGKLPEVTKNLFEYFSIKKLSESKGVVKISKIDNGFLINFNLKNIEIDKLNMIILEEKLKYDYSSKGIIAENFEEMKRVLKKL